MNVQKLKENSLFKRLFCLEMWNIGRTKNLESALENGIWKDIEWLDVDVKNTFYADPVGSYKHNKETRILFEKLDIKTNRGEIVSISESDFSNGGPIHDEIVGNSFHMSYPTTVKSLDSEILLIPEQSQSRCLESYERKDSRWQQKGLLIKNQKILDPTFHHDVDYDYMFHTLQNDGPNSILRLAYKPNTLDEWIEHPESPFNVGSYGARPAGPIIKYKDELIRPGQDNRGGYGSAIVLFRIKSLSPQSYEEEFIRVINPPNKPYNYGTHSIFISDEYTYLDAKRYDYTFKAIFIKLKNVIRARIKR